VGDLLVRVCREGLVNAAKHAGPSKVSVTVQVDSAQRWRLTIDDDGVGLPESDSYAGHGLRALRRAIDEHGGTLSLSRLPHGGTRLTASIGS
jgi:signal transduction histidine kinase